MTGQTAFRLHLPRDLEFDKVRAFIRSLSSIGGLRPPAFGLRPKVVLELHVDSRGASYYLLLPETAAQAEVGLLAASVPGVVAEPVDVPLIAVASAAELRLTRSDRALRTDQPANLISPLLAGMTPRAGRIVWQLVVVPMPHRDRLREVDRARREPESLFEHLSTSDALIARSDIRQKQSEPPFSVCLRIGAAGEGNHRAMVGHAISCLRTLASAGVTLTPRMLPSGAVVRRLQQRRAAAWSWPAVLNAEELAVLAAWPTEGTRTTWNRGPQRRLLAAGPSIPSSGRVFGRSAQPLPVRAIATPVAAIRHHTHLIGPTGTGKTTLLAQLVLQDIDAGRAVVVIDPKGDLVRYVLARISDRDADVAVIDPSDDERPVGMNLLDVAGRADREATVEMVLSLLHRLYAASWGPRTQDILHASLMTMAGHDEATLVDLPLLLTRPDYRHRFVSPVDDPLGVGGFWNWYEALSPAEQAQVLGPVLNKLRTLLLRPRLRNIVGQPTSTVDLRAVLDERGVVLATLAVGTLGADAAHLLGALLVGRLWQAIRSRRNRQIASVYIDEFQDVLHLPTDLADVLAQARSYGVGLTLAHQHLGQLGPDMRSAVLANARSRVAFQSGSEDARVLARVLGDGLSLEDLSGLPAFEAYAQLYAADATQPPLSLATDPLAAPAGHDLAIRARSRLRYGTPRDEIEQQLRRRIEGASDQTPIGRRRRAS